MARIAGDRSGTRSQILGAAADLFAERGFHATSLRDLAERVGLSKAAVHYHFRSKDDLLDALLEPAFDRIEAVVDEAPPAPLDRESARALLSHYQSALLQAGAVMHLIDSDPSTLARPSVHIRFRKHQQSMQTLLAGPDLDERRCLRARAAIAVLHSTCIASPVTDEGRPLVVADDLEGESVDAALDALGR